MTETPPQAPGIVDQEYELVEVDRLEQHPRNARRGKVTTITDSYDENGFYGAVVVQRSTGFVIAGNHRLLAARATGMAQLPAIWADVDDDAALRIMAVDNRANDVAGYDTDALAEVLQLLSGSDRGLAGTGFDDDDLAALLNSGTPQSRTDPDDAPDLPGKKPVSKEGDVWRLGPHRVVCGHGEDPTAVEAALEGKPADLLFTDPPYGVAYVGGTAEKLTIANDALSADDLGKLLVGAFGAADHVLRPGASFYICSPSGVLETTFRLALAEVGLELRQQLVWVKHTFVLGRADYHGQHETMLYGWQGGEDPPVPPHFDAEHDTMLYGWTSGAAHAFEGGRKQSTVWEYDKPSRSDVHPTMKPVDLVKRAIHNSTGPGGRVLDMFAGSGSTLIAAYLTGRVAGCVELDPRYVDVICRRFQEHTGVLPVRESTGKPHDFTKGTGRG